jgi:S-adenosylmethionine hydrolase
VQQPIISFISDFGLDDTWVGVCHALIARACPDVVVVDLGHQVPVFDVRAGASMAAAGVHQLPDAIHLVVVDPGVGGGRRDLVVVTKRGTLLVGPDNGILLPASRRGGGIALAVALPQPSQGAPTFHARDVLAPAAAALACGSSAESLGEVVDPASLVAAPFGEAVRDGDYVLGEVLEADRFGSLRLSIPCDDLDSLGLRSDRVEIGLGHNTLAVPFGKTFCEVPEGEPIALVDASGWLVLAVNLGSALERYGVVPGVPVRVRALRE